MVGSNSKSGTVEDVVRRAQERGVVVTDSQAQWVLARMKKHFDPATGTYEEAVDKHTGIVIALDRAIESAA